MVWKKHPHQPVPHSETDKIFFFFFNFNFMEHRFSITADIIHQFIIQKSGLLFRNRVPKTSHKERPTLHITYYKPAAEVSAQIPGNEILNHAHAVQAQTTFISSLKPQNINKTVHKHKEK